MYEMSGLLVVALPEREFARCFTEKASAMLPVDS
jgi:hypothetical protein